MSDSSWNTGTIPARWPLRRDRRAVEIDRPRVGPDHARKHLDQRGLARAVLAEHRMDAAARAFETGTFERTDPAVALRDALHAE
jgi:hypothetical protein